MGGMPVEGVRAELSQPSAKVAAAYKAAGVEEKGLRQVAAESAFRRGGLANKHNRTISLHHATKHEIKIHKSV